ncbi:serine hydrolase domain-containing protein [Klugiella xanthotipulae]|uniref:D-alanyl-D-alanine carboxypeptidase n=1 Tax=Klugiella xanthotipulae TaxID=244735 RepID=A0A543I6L8_9MICO|nr:serine hydrolase domain-containing protein [Klugiella xanthotipulae]TQM66218.1 D-alanyl-D-alanine carboxypeptidase [Klugiella xanthotipulae]
MSFFSSKTLRTLAATGVIAVLLGVSGCTEDGALNLDGPGDQALSDTTTERLQTAVTEAMQAAGASGALVGVWAPWAGNWEAGIGTTETGGGSEVTTDMAFRVGHVSGMMTCAVLLAMVDDGVVGLDDKAADYLAHQAGITGITLRQLCQGTSSLGDFEPGLRAQFDKNPTRIWPPGELISNGLVMSPDPLTPGTLYAKSSTNMVVLGRALEVAANSSWENLINKYLFGPLSLSHTNYPEASELTLPTDSLPGYAIVPKDGVPDCANPIPIEKLSNSMLAQAGGVTSTLSDLQRFASGYMDGNLLNEGSTASIIETAPLTAPKLDDTGNPVPLTAEEQAAADLTGSGLGVIKNGPLYGQSGSIPGYTTALLHDPTSGLTIAVVINSSAVKSDFVTQLALRLASIIAETDGGETFSVTWTEADTTAAMETYRVCPAP